jgi:23S rRNA pseudouridine2605 synthase
VASERLQKILARAGIASRRKCEELIVQGRVTVDGAVVKELGRRVDPGRQVVECDGVALKAEKLVCLALYKPRGFVSSARREGGAPCVLELVPGFAQRLFPVGRLDRDSEGLLILTNDGNLSQHLTHPVHGVAKTYRVTVSGHLTVQQAKGLAHPEWTSDGRMQLDEARVLSRGRKRSEIEVTLKEGRNREIRRILAAKGIKVRRLIRTAVGPVTVHGLAPGRYRHLTPAELRAFGRKQ